MKTAKLREGASPTALDEQRNDVRDFFGAKRDKRSTSRRRDGRESGVKNDEKRFLN